MTTPEEALEFLDTGIDFLAPAFGNVHGGYGSRGPEAHLQLDRLEAIQKAVQGKASLVLHGSGGFTQSLFRDCIEAGISKINVNVHLIKPWTEMMHARTKFVPLSGLIEESISVFQKQVAELMQMVGSAGQARTAADG